MHVCSPSLSVLVVLVSKSTFSSSIHLAVLFVMISLTGIDIMFRQKFPPHDIVILGYSQNKRQRNWFNIEENISNAVLHKININKKIETPNNEIRISSYGIDPLSIYHWPFIVVKNVKLAMLRIKINHNIIYTKDKLEKDRGGGGCKKVRLIGE